jgi:hypothetical protein
LVDHLPVKIAFRSRRLASERGSTMLELAMMLTVAVPLLLGVAGVGLQLGRTLSATQATRDVSHMYALGADFSLPGAKNIAATLSRDFTLTSTGNAVMILSRIVKVYQADCTANSLRTCPNLNQTVFTQRIVIGNASLFNSYFGTPPASYIDSSGNIKATDYEQQSTLVASGFGNVLSLQDNQVALMVEGYFSMPELNLLGGPSGGGGYYARMLF